MVQYILNFRKKVERWKKEADVRHLDGQIVSVQKKMYWFKGAIGVLSHDVLCLTTKLIVREIGSLNPVSQPHSGLVEPISSVPEKTRQRYRDAVKGVFTLPGWHLGLTG